jgi:hypothetical protein
MDRIGATALVSLVLIAAQPAPRRLAALARRRAVDAHAHASVLISVMVASNL